MSAKAAKASSSSSRSRPPAEEPPAEELRALEVGAAAVAALELKYRAGGPGPAVMAGAARALERLDAHTPNPAGDLVILAVEPGRREELLEALGEVLELHRA